MFNFALSIQGTSSVSTNEGYINETNVKEVFLQILRGRDGRDGLPGRDGQKGERGYKGEKGEKGETGAVGGAGPKSGGVVYTRWGRKSCPNDTGAQLVYEGITGGSGTSVSQEEELTMSVYQRFLNI